MDFNINRLSQIFKVPAAEYSLFHLQLGHINTTYKVLKDGLPIYILQKVNTSVFNNVDKLMENYLIVVRCFNDSLPDSNLNLRVPQIVPCHNDKLYYSDDESQYWRLITYIDGKCFTKMLAGETTSFEGGRAFGSFLKGISSINPQSLHEILPEFHSLQKRYDEFLTSMETNTVKRVSGVADEIEFVRNRHHKMMKIPTLLAENIIPLRIVHNDTKLSNVLFSEAGKAVGVIDLDTVMPGSALFDFGDAIRSSANTACEDEPDLSKVGFDLKQFEAFTSGYLDSAGDILSEKEIELLPEAALLMTYIIGIRFLTDFLNGDIYYQTQYPDHNLIRARVQFKLLSQMESELENMHTVIDQIMIKTPVKQ